MMGLLMALLGIGVYMILNEMKEKHWKEVIVPFFLAILSVLLTVSYVWDIPQLLLPFAWMRGVFEQLANILYQLF